ncbi:MAG: hypothetical protein KAY37_01885 [Phycisphaerae bacterium]|nr:hypothetical protein [Phycisphaerae bacterium]
MRTYRFLPPLLLLAWYAGPGPAQSPEDALSEIRARPQISDEDRNLIRTFITERVTEITGENPEPARTATKTLRDGFTGSNEFKKAYANICIQVLGPACREAELVPATYLLTVLNTLNVPEARALLIEALRDKRVGVRAAAAIGLRNLRPKLAQAGGQNYTATLNALKEAGKKEKSRATLRSIYSALDYSAVPRTPDLKPDVAALLELLETRAGLYLSEQEVPALGADDLGLKVGERLLNTMTRDDRNRLTVVAATMMKYALEKYTSPARKLYEVRDKSGNRQLIEYRNAMERLVLVGEKLLVALLLPEKAPEVMTPMRKLDGSQMKLAWQEWVKLLQDKVKQDFSLVEPPESEAGEAEGEDRPSGG